MRSVALIAVAATAAGSPAAGQDVGKFPSTPTFVASNLVAARMGQCLLKHDRRRATALADADPASAAYPAVKRAVAPPMIACLHGARSATLDLFYVRGAVSEALLRENGAALLHAASATAPVAPARLHSAGQAGAAPAIIACAVDADPADAGALVMAEAATPAEVAALDRLAPSLQACAPASGEVTLRRPTVRPRVAIALYRLGRGTAAHPSSNGAN